MPEGRFVTAQERNAREAILVRHVKGWLVLAFVVAPVVFCWLCIEVSRL